MAKKATKVTQFLEDGPYWCPDKSGWGLFVNTVGGVKTFSMFTFDSSGNQLWLNFVQRDDGKFDGYAPSGAGFMNDIRASNDGPIIAEAEIVLSNLPNHATLNVAIDSAITHSGFSQTPPATLRFTAPVNKL